MRTLLFCGVLIIATGAVADPISTSFTYQGELMDTGRPANGTYDLQFELYDVDSGGAIVGSAVLIDNQSVENGIFSVELDFGTGPFAGDQLWLEIGVRDGSSAGGFTSLLPRQKLTAAPYALHAEMVAANSIAGAEIANNSVTAADLATNSVAAAEIAANAVGASEIDSTQVQRRIAPCPTGEYIRSVNENGTVTCEPRDPPWRIAIPPAQLINSSIAEFWPAMTFGSGTSAVGTAFNDEVFGRVWFGFELPQQYTPGADLQMDLQWLPISGFGLPVIPCDVIFWMNDISVSRDATAAFRAGETWEIPRGFDNTQTRLTANAFDGVVNQTFAVIDGTNLLPGDMLSAAFNRDGDESADTCAGIMVTGISFHER